MPTLFYEDLRNIIQYVYTGYVYIAANSLDSFLTAARCLQLLQDKEVSVVVVEPDQVTQEDQEDILRDSHMEEGQTRLPEEEDCLPLDLSMKSLHKKTMLEESPHYPLSFPAEKAKSPRHKTIWSQAQMQDAIESVVTQRLKLSQASAKFGIPKGTLYDWVLGKENRFLILDQVGLNKSQELAVLDFCCNMPTMPYKTNTGRRTSRSLLDVIKFMTRLKEMEGDQCVLTENSQLGFKWWWAFTRKYKITSILPV